MTDKTPNLGWPQDQRDLDAREALQAAAPSLPAGDGLTVPDGWKLVPVEPTDAMVKTAIGQRDDYPNIRAGGKTYPELETKRAYRAMLNVAPAAPRQPGEMGAGHDRDKVLDEVMQERDAFHEIADKLADGIAAHLGVDIGEHSSANCPWTNALEWIENPPAAAPAPYKDSTPELKIGDSSFESWYEQYAARISGNPKQTARDAYAAGMGDPLVVAASAQQDERRTVKFPDAEGNEVSAYLTFDELAQRFRNAADELVELRAGKTTQQDEREAWRQRAESMRNVAGDNALRVPPETMLALLAQQVQADAGPTAAQWDDLNADMGEIIAALGLSPDSYGGAEPIVQAIEDLKARASQVQADAGEVATPIPGRHPLHYTGGCFIRYVELPDGVKMEHVKGDTWRIVVHPSPAAESDKRDMQVVVTPTDAETIAEMTKLVPWWNTKGRSRESAVRLALEAYRHLAAMSREQSGGDRE